MDVNATADVGHIVLSRRIEESIQIGPDVSVKVIEIGRGRVRLLITAPRSVTVDRSEVRERRDAEAGGTDNGLA